MLMTKKKLILGEGLAQGLHDTTLTTNYSLNFTASRNKFCLNLHYNRANSYLFGDVKEIIKLKTEVTANLLCLGNISDKLSADNMSNTGL